MPQDGPIICAAAVADGFAWAHYSSESSCRYPRMGPLSLLQLLPMVSPGPIISPRAPADAQGPIESTTTCVDDFPGAHLHFGEALLMPEGEPFNRQRVALFCPFLAHIMFGQPDGCQAS